MRIRTQTFRLTLDDRFTGVRQHHEAATALAPPPPAAPGEPRTPGPLPQDTPTFNVALGEWTDLDELLEDEGIAPPPPGPGDEPNDPKVRAYFDTKRPGVTSFEDTVETAAGGRALVRRGFSEPEIDGTATPMFHLFVNRRLDDRFMQEYSADCRVDERDTFEPLFWAAIHSTEWFGDRDAVMDAENARHDALLQKANAMLAEFEASASSGPPPNRSADAAPADHPAPFNSAAATAPFRLRVGPADFTAAGPSPLVPAAAGVEISMSGGELVATAHGRADAPPPGLLDEGNDAHQVDVTVALTGVCGPGGVPTATLQFNDGQPEAPAAHGHPRLRIQGPDYALKFTGTLTLAEGWFALRGVLADPYAPAPRFPLELDLRFDPSALDWSAYTFTTPEELDHVAPDVPRRVRLTLTDPAVFPAKLTDRVNLTELSVHVLGHHPQGAPPPLDLPASLGQLTRLRTLALSNFAPRALPDTLGCLTALTRLSLNNLNLPDLPADIWQLPELELLSLQNNRLTELPDAIRLPRLRTLNLRGNRLTELPEALVTLPALARLDLTDNPWQSLPEAVATLDLELPVADKRRLLNYDYPGADGRGTAPWDDTVFRAVTTPALAAEADALIARHPLPQPQAAALRASARHAVGFTPQTLEPAADAYADLGGHRFGGMPDLPPGVAYPRAEARDGDPAEGVLCEFIAQLNCDQLAPLQNYLPRTGVLFFFITGFHRLYEGPDARPARVLHHDTPADQLVSGRTLNFDPADYDEMFDPAYDVHPCDAHALPSFPDPGPARPTPNGDAVTAAAADLHRVSNQLHGHVHSVNPHVFTQHESPEDQAASALRGDPADWLVLLRVASHGSFQWGDAGELFFVIHKSDLARQDFTNVFCTMESS